MTEDMNERLAAQPWIGIRTTLRTPRMQSGNLQWCVDRPGRSVIVPLTEKGTEQPQKPDPSCILVPLLCSSCIHLFSSQLSRSGPDGITSLQPQQPWSNCASGRKRLPHNLPPQRSPIPSNRPRQPRPMDLRTAAVRSPRAM